MKKKQMSDIFDLLKESKGDDTKESIELNIEEFKSALSQVDSQMKNLPATAQVSCYFYLVMPNNNNIIYQRHISLCMFCLPSKMTMQVASQQGVYLAKCFNRMEECEKNPEGPLRFRGTGRHRFRPFRYNLNYYFKLCSHGHFRAR